MGDLYKSKFNGNIVELICHSKDMSAKNKNLKVVHLSKDLTKSGQPEIWEYEGNFVNKRKLEEDEIEYHMHTWIRARSSYLDEQRKKGSWVNDGNLRKEDFDKEYELLNQTAEEAYFKKDTYFKQENEK